MTTANINTAIAFATTKIATQIEQAMLILIEPRLDECVAEYQSNGRVVTAYYMAVQKGWIDTAHEAKYRAGLVMDYRKLRETANKYPHGAEYRTYLLGQMDALHECLRFWDSDMNTAMGHCPKAVDELIDKLLTE